MMIVESMIRLELCSVLSDLYRAREALLKARSQQNLAKKVSIVVDIYCKLELNR